MYCNEGPRPEDCQCIAKTRDLRKSSPKEEYLCCPELVLKRVLCPECHVLIQDILGLSRLDIRASMCHVNR